MGVCYEPLPSDFTSWNQGGIYPPTGGDFANSAFQRLWGPLPGRNDLSTIRNGLGAGGVRLYNSKTSFSHTTFYGRANGAAAWAG